MTHKVFSGLMLIVLLVAACSTPAPTPTPTLTPAPPTATATFTPTIDIAPTQTAQAQATATAQTIATATAQAQANATGTAQALATATGQAQATAVARANATATIQALVAAINAQSDAAPGKPYVSAEGTVNGEPAPYITAFDPGQYVKNFDAQVQLFNPADGKIHPWDYGFRFRRMRPNGYDLITFSDGTWLLYLIQKGAADAVTGTAVASGRIQKFDNSPTGSNTIRLVARGASGTLFINGDFVTSLDLSGFQEAGDIYLATGSSQGTNFPGLVLRYKNLSIKGLP